MRITKNLAYLAGAAEDAHLDMNKKRGYQFDLESKSKRWIDEGLMPRLASECCAVAITKRRGYYRIRVCDKALVTKLNEIKRNPHVILSASPTAQLSWVRGFIDAEGSVTVNGSKQPMVSIYNNELDKLQIVETVLQKFGIHVHFYKPKDRKVWQQYLTGRKNLQKLLDKVGLEHPDKREKLITVLAP